MTQKETLNKLIELKQLIQEVGFSKVKNRIGREAIVRPCRCIEYQLFREVRNGDINSVLNSLLLYDTYAAFRYVCQQLAREKEYNNYIKLKITLD